jgi:catechol 2,3-dioxygenase-like lactoylglutathione lyase family enzyme
MHVFASVVIVSDLDRALAFYEGKLGWTVRTDNQLSPDYRFVCVADVDEHLLRL